MNLQHQWLWPCPQYPGAQGSFLWTWFLGTKRPAWRPGRPPTGWPATKSNPPFWQNNITSFDQVNWTLNTLTFWLVIVCESELVDLRRRHICCQTSCYCLHSGLSNSSCCTTSLFLTELKIKTNIATFLLKPPIFFLPLKWWVCCNHRGWTLSCKHFD